MAMQNIKSDTSGSATGSAAAVFQSGEYLLGIVQHAMTAQENTRIVLPGKGEITILPASGVYYAATQNFIEFCRTPAGQFEVEKFGEVAQPYQHLSKKDIKMLLWQAAFHASQGRLIEGCSIYDVVKFRCWPNLTRLSITPNTARICALLTRNPTTIMLVHRLIGIERAEVYQIYSAASCTGICHKTGKNPDHVSVEDNLKLLQPAKERSLLRSLFSKISRL